MREESKMPSQLETTLNSAVAKIVDGIEDFSKLTITTEFVVIEEQQEAAAGGGQQTTTLPKAVTTIHVDGDYGDTIPLRRVKAEGSNETKLKVNLELHNLHLQNVARAIEYRQGFINTLMDVAKSLIGG